MAGRYPEPIVLDATVLSNFASTNAIEFLVEVLDSPVVVPAVRDEIEQGKRFGHDFLATAVEAFDDGLRVSDVPAETGTVQFRERLDAGEAGALRGTIEHEGTLATDDLAARHLADYQDCQSPDRSACSCSASNVGASTKKRRTNGSTRGAIRVDTTPRGKRRGGHGRVAASLTNVGGRDTPSTRPVSVHRKRWKLTSRNA